MSPDHVLVGGAEILRLVERGDDRADGVGTDLVTALDELDELVDDGARLIDLELVPVEGQDVAAKRDRAGQPLAEGGEHSVPDARELGGDVVRNLENLMHGTEV